MGAEYVNPQEMVGAGLVMGGKVEEGGVLPKFIAKFVCYGPDGLPRWDADYSNVVTDEGRGAIINRLFGCTGAYTANWYMGLHSLAATAQSHALSLMTTRELGSYGANRPTITFASNYVTGSASATASFGFTAGTQTCSGAFVCGGTTGAGGQATANTQAVLYSEGNFGASRQVQNGDTLSVTVTITY